MFKGHWLVADVDGTLLPTPTKAGGKYLSFTGSVAAFADRSNSHYPSCLPMLRSFLDAGGSLCVVSTAGKRLWQQIYVDLAPSLFPTPLPDAATALPGKLLICGFTGAAVFRSVDPRTLPARDGADGSHPPAPPPPASHGLEEWTAYRSAGETTLSDAAQAAAAVEGRAAIIRFFEHVSAVSGHDVDKAAVLFTHCLSRKYHRVFTEMLGQMLSEVTEERGGAPLPEGPLCFANTSVMRMERLTRHGEFLVETVDALVDCQRVPQADGTVPPDAAVAQVVVMGIPMRYFDLLFPKPSSAKEDGGDAGARASEAKGTTQTLQCCPACLARATHHPDGSVAGLAQLEGAPMNLAVKRQPNSVCIHRAGVDKGTCVRWLLASAKSFATEKDHSDGFALERALSFGDVPATVDRPLADFPPMHMISLSPLPKDGCATDEELRELEALGMIHVGGEEEGTALFLDALIKDCARTLAERGEGTPTAGSSAAAPACPTDGTWFTKERLQACAAKAQEGLAKL